MQDPFVGDSAAGCYTVQGYDIRCFLVVGQSCEAHVAKTKTQVSSLAFPSLRGQF